MNLYFHSEQCLQLLAPNYCVNIDTIQVAIHQFYPQILMLCLSLSLYYIQVGWYIELVINASSF